MKDLTNIWRKHILGIKPYSSARDEYTGTEGIFLDANENPYGATSGDVGINRYPDPYQLAVKAKIAKVKGVDASKIFLGNGSDEPIDLLIRAACEPGENNIIIVPPTYGMYKVSADINAVEAREVLLSEDFQLRPQAILDAVDDNTKIIFLCSPNNPTGNDVARKDILKILQGFNGLLVVDEAYIDFTEQESLLTVLDVYPNLLIMQTFSKAWGLAGLRLGMAFASEEIIKVLNLIKPPYNIGGLTQEAALRALDNEKQKDLYVARIVSERERVMTFFATLDIVEKVYPSVANFFLVKVRNAKHVFDALIKEKVIVRDRSRVKRCEEGLRITIGTEEENNRLMEKIKAL